MAIAAVSIADLRMKIHQAASGWGVSSGRSTSLPLTKVTPTRTRTTRVGCVDCAPAGLGGFDELERHGSPAAREPGLLVTLLQWRHIGFLMRP